MNIVFLGPSLPLYLAKELAPEGTHFLPAVAQSDIASLCRVKAPKAIGIVDGIFRKSLSVWHKEILFALSLGVRVLGASSMGALRAVECEPWGAEPIGKIAQWVKQGKVSDGDVALSHADKEFGFRGISLPLVNVIATLEKCTGIEIGRREEILAAARAIFYADRAWTDIAKAADCSRDERHAITTHFTDQKSLDAQELLVALGKPRTTSTDFPVAKNIHEGYGAVLQGNDVRLPCADKKIRRAYEIATANNWCAAQGADRQLAVECTRLLGLEERARAEVAGMMAQPEFAAKLCRKLDLLPHELERFLLDEQMLVHGRTWVQAIDMGFGDTPRTLNYLRGARTYPEMKTFEQTKPS